MFSACRTYEKQLRIEKTRLSHQVWSHRGSTFNKNMTLNGHFSRPAETDPYVPIHKLGNIELHLPEYNSVRRFNLQRKNSQSSQIFLSGDVGQVCPSVLFNVNIPFQDGLRQSAFNFENILCSDLQDKGDGGYVDKANWEKGKDLCQLKTKETLTECQNVRDDRICQLQSSLQVLEVFHSPC